MDIKRTAAILGLVLVLITTAVEVEAWWRLPGESAERRRAGWISVLNVAAAILLIAG